jgi:glucosyl-dolichyl phosphate glucuronosyltransferase
MLTVLFSTKNRSRLLSEVLESFCRLQSPASGWKLIVVDNGSTDRTSQVLASFTGRLPLRALVELNPGKNMALNTALRFLEGDLAVFTDDDVFPRADWLLQLRKAADAFTDYTMFGGTIVPRWEVPAPRWVQWVPLSPVFTLTDLDQKAGQLSPFLVFGPNMAIRSSVFHAGIRFNPAVGPSGSNYSMGSETELTARLDRLGHKALFVPDAVVEHFIRKSQLSTHWVLKRAFRYGRGFFRLFRSHQLDDSGIGRRMDIPKPLIHEIIDAAVTLPKAAFSFNEEAIFRARYQLNFLRGQAFESRILMQERRETSQSLRSHAS